MPGFSDYLEGKILDWMNGTAMPTAPAAQYISLHNGDPTDTGTGGTDVTTTVRAAGRVVGAFSRTAGVNSSSGDVNFGAAAAGATFSHWAAWDASSGGNMLMSGSITGGPYTVGAGTVVKFAAGQLTETVD